jgi:hypothetical protein
MHTYAISLMPMQSPDTSVGASGGTSLSDVIAVAALALALVSFLWTVYTHLKQRKLDREQHRLDREHRALEQQVLNAQLADRAESTAALRRSLRVQTEGFQEKLAALQDRRMTPDGMRGAILWTEAEVHRLVDQSSRYSDDAAEAAGSASTALDNAAGFIRPHLVKNPRVLAPPFDPDQLAFELRTASEQLQQLHRLVNQDPAA